jgi:hypothetical protein
LLIWGPPVQQISRTLAPRFLSLLYIHMHTCMHYSSSGQLGWFTMATT